MGDPFTTPLQRKAHSKRKWCSVVSCKREGVVLFRTKAHFSGTILVARTSNVYQREIPKALARKLKTVTLTGIEANTTWMLANKGVD